MNAEADRPPCLYLLWPRGKQDVPDVAVPAQYILRPFRSGDEPELLDLQSCDGDAMTNDQWREYRDALLPNGLFLVEEVASRQLVATAGAVHNPNPGRYYFPFGGELGYLIVRPEHRRRGLGRAVCAAVVRRFLSAGYESIRVCVQEHRHAALRSYIRLGFEPFVHSATVEQRWRRVCGALNLPFSPELWRTTVS